MSSSDAPVMYVVNAGPAYFWIVLSIILLFVSFIFGYFISFWGSLYFLSANFIIYFIFFLVGYSIESLSKDVWLYTVDQQPLILIPQKTESFVFNAIPLSIFAVSLLIFNLFLLLLYFFVVRKVINFRHITIINRSVGGFICLVQAFIFICFIFGIVGSDIFYTSSSNFNQNFSALVKNPSLLTKRYNSLSSTIFYKFYILLNYRY